MDAATFLFADIAGFTALTEAHGDEEAADLVADFCRAVQAELPAYGGVHLKTIGDALMLRGPDSGRRGPARPAHHARADERPRRPRGPRRPAPRSGRRTRRR